MKIIFDRACMKDWGDKQQEISDQLKQCLSSGKCFVVELYEIKETKSYLQLRALYKLFELARPYFTKWRPTIIWTDERIKERVKEELKYTIPLDDFEIAMMIKQTGFTPKTKEERKTIINHCKEKRKNRSFKDFTKEEMYNFTMEFEVWAQTPILDTKGKEIKLGWPDVFLTSAEQMAMDKVYGIINSK